MNTKNELRELDDEELNTVQGGMSCCNGAHLNEATMETRSLGTVTVLDAVLIALGL
jgi:bacteriocin-like protein